LEAEARNLREQADQQAEMRRNITTAVGWYDRESADPRTDPAAVASALEDLRATFSDLGEADKDFETAVPKVVAAFNQRGRKIAELESRVQTLESQLQVANSTVAQVTSEKDKLIAELRQQSADEQQNAASRESDLQARLDAATAQVSERDLELRQARAEGQRVERAGEQEASRLKTRINELTEVTKFSRAPFSDAPDAKVVAVSGALNLGWIDIGANQRVTRGIRFRVESSSPTNRRQKAWAQVTKVEASRAEVAFTELADSFDPVVPGDVLVNPLFDPTGGRNAILVGRFSGAYNEQDLKILLERMGIHVQPRLDLTTHFMIVGSELWNDPETNEPLEEAVQPSELPVYKDAEALGVQIIPLQDIREYFRAGAGSESAATTRQ
jgi:hypothetical protein